MQSMIKRVMRIDRCIVIGIGLVVAHQTEEHLAPLLHDALAASEGEPLPLAAASGAILARAVRGDLDGDHRRAGVDLLPRVPPGLSARLVCYPAGPPPGVSLPLWLELARPPEDQ